MMRLFYSVTIPTLTILTIWCIARLVHIKLDLVTTIWIGLIMVLIALRFVVFE